VGAGIILQIDAPDLAMGRHTMYRDRSLEEFESLAARHIEVLNHALRNVPAERARMHVCWGNYEGPHHHDVPMARLLPIVLKAKPQGLLFEAANPRHAHEWSVFRDASIPDDKILIPGMLATTTNYVEHPQLVAERIERFADIVGRERVMAGTDCGFGTFAGFGPVGAGHRIPEAQVAGRGSAARLATPLELSLSAVAVPQEPGMNASGDSSPGRTGGAAHPSPPFASMTTARSTWLSSPPAMRRLPSRAARDTS